MSNRKPDEEFNDPKTGEKVTRHKVPEKLLEEIQKHFNQHSQNERNFSQFSQQYFQILSMVMDAREKMTKTQVDLRKCLQIVCKKMDLPKDDWVYSLPLKMMELRKPPNYATQPNTVKPIEPDVGGPNR